MSLASLTHTARKNQWKISTLEYKLNCNENSNTNARTQVLPHFTIGIPFLVLILFYFLTRPRWRLLDEKTKLAQREFIKNFCANPDANKNFNVITVDGVTTEFCREVIRLNEKDSSSKPAAVMGTGLVVSSSKHDDSS